MSTEDTFAATLRSAEECGYRAERGAATSPCAAAFKAGELIAGRYELQSSVAAGGMGQIWKAHDRFSGQTVAVKLAHPRDEGSGSVASVGLLQEARLAATVEHPAIIKVIDSGHVDEREEFIVFELLEGEDLRARLRREGGISATEAVRLLLPILEALAALHAKGIVHRDLKPDNIFLVRSQVGLTPKLVDFGIALAESDPVGDEALIGSPGYMSPEQARGGAHVDSRTDLWALAVVLYESIAGAQLWEGRNWPALRKSIVSRDASCLVGVHGVDRALWEILARGLEKSPAARWQTARSFAAVLRQWLAAQDARTERLQRSGRARSDRAGASQFCVRTIRSPCAGEGRAIEMAHDSQPESGIRTRSTPVRYDSLDPAAVKAPAASRLTFKTVCFGALAGAVARLLQ